MTPVLGLSIALTILSDAAYAVIVGTVLAGRWLDATDSLSADPEHSALATHAFSIREQRRLLLFFAITFLLVHLVHPWFLAASMSGSNNFASDLALIPTIISSTHQGSLWGINSAAIVLLFIGLFAGPPLAKRIPTVAVIAALIILGFTKAASGHAADDGNFTLTVFSQFLHIIATAVWAGSVLVSGLIILPRLIRNATPATLWGYGSHLSTTVTWALAGLLISGIYTSDRELNNTLSGLWTSAWGKILFVKVTFVLIAIFLGALSRFLCLGHPDETGKAALMVRLMRIEATVMICILCLSGLLGNTAPAMSGSMSM